MLTCFLFIFKPYIESNIVRLLLNLLVELSIVTHDLIRQLCIVNNLHEYLIVYDSHATKSSEIGMYVVGFDDHDYLRF